MLVLGKTLRKKQQYGAYHIGLLTMQIQWAINDISTTGKVLK